MVRKETYKGLEEEQLRDMPLEKFLELTNSRNRRTFSRLKENPELKKFMTKVSARKKKGMKPGKAIKTKIRDAIVIPEWLGLTFGVYNGKEYKNVLITVDMLGHRLGEFSHTTGRVQHSGPGVGATRGSKFIPLK